MALGVFDDVGTRHAAVAVEVDLHLRHLKLQGSAGHPAGTEDPGKIPHPAEQAMDVGRHLYSGRVGIREEDVDLFIGESPAALDRGRFDRRVHRDALRRELDPAGPCVADLAGLQAREIVGDDLRDHRDHTVGQIDAGATVAGLLVER